MSDLSLHKLLPVYDISVVIPLYDVRIDEVKCFTSWCQQSLAREHYEVIAVSNGDFPQVDARVKELLTEHDQFLTCPGGNMSDLYDLGVRSARSELPFLTELHCIARHDLLEKVLDYMNSHDVDGACVRTDIPEQNTFGQVEASLFSELAEEWYQEGDWRKVLVRGFAIKKDKYIAAGGIQGRYPRFADWVLAARLDNLGCRLGYAREAGLIHYYSTSCAQFFPIVRIHILDECGFRDTETEQFCNKYFGIHPDWSLRNTYSRRWQLHMLHLHMRLLLMPSAWSGSIRKSLGLFSNILQHGVRTITGLLPKLVRYRLKLIYNRIMCSMLSHHFDRLKKLYPKAYHAIEDYYRLEYLANHPVPPVTPALAQQQYLLAEMDGTALPGFYAAESHEGKSFRWSSNAAEIVLGLPADDYLFTFDTMNIAGNPHSRLLGVFFNNQPASITPQQQDGKVTVRVNSAMFKEGCSQYLQLLVTSVRLPFSTRETRRLGLPIVSLECQHLD